MPCGCQSACGCEVIGDGSTADVVRNGDTFIVSARQYISSHADTDCIDLSVTPEGELSAEPIIDPDTECVALSCTPSGIRADLVIDPASTAPISCSEDGLRVDCCDPEPPPQGLVPPGTVVSFDGILVPSGWLECDGSEVAQVGLEGLYDALTLYSTTADRAAGIAQITNLATTRYIQPGHLVLATGFSSAPLTVVSVDSPTQITVSANADTDGTGDTEVRVYVTGTPVDPYFNFLLPNRAGRTDVCVDDIGGVDQGVINWPNELGYKDGDQNVTLSSSQIPAHDHPANISDPGHSHSASTGPAGSHSHGPGTAGRSFVTVEPPLTQVLIANDAPDDIGIQLGAPINLGVDQQGNNASTDTESDHTHTVSVNSSATGISVDVLDNIGGGGSHENMQPSFLTRKIIKT